MAHPVNTNISSTVPTRAIVFASEQLVPALQFLLHTADRLGSKLHTIHIYHTPDDSRSAAPARRLQSLLEKWSRQRGLSFDIVLSCADANPAGVRQALLRWFEQHPDDAWLVNVTGGTKPMAAAAVELTLSTDLAQRRVLYQEIDGQWFELLPEADGLLDMQALAPHTEPLVPPPDALERLLQLSDRVATQFSEVHTITDQTIPAGVPLERLTEALIRNRWHWQSAFDCVQGAPRVVSNGEGFEVFLGAGLQACGVQLRHSLKVCENPPQGKVVREVDLVAGHRGRLVCIDIKLPGADEHAKGTQLADVAELAHSLGGRGALPVAVRPGWPHDPSLQRLAEAMGVKLLTQEQAAQPFSTLLAWIGKDLQPNAAVRQVEQWLTEHQQRGRYVLSDGRMVTKPQAADSGLLHLPTELEAICARRGEPWALAQMNELYLLGVPKKRLPPQLQQGGGSVAGHLNRLLDHYANQVSYQRDAPAWYTALFTLRPGVKRETLVEALRRELGAP